MPKTQYMTIDEMAKIFATPITTKHGGEQAFIDFCRYDEDKNTKHMNDMLQSELDRNHIMDRNYLIRELKNDLKGHEALFERLQHKIIENDITTYDKLLKLLQQEKMNVDEKKQLEYIIDLAEYMSSSPKPPKDYKNIVLQFQQALSDKTPEAKEFLKNLTLFITAFHSERDDSIARAMRILANKIQDQKVLYNLLRDFGFDQTVETNEILWRTKYDLIINKTPSCATADNIFSYVKDMEWLTGHFDQKLYERGLQRFYEEINEEAAKDKPDFDRLLK